MNRRNYETNRQNIINAMRSLWEQHGILTRSFIISAVEELDDLEYVTQRLLRNPKDFAVVLNGFYGSDIANQFDALLSDHFLIAADLVNHAKAGDTASVEEDRVRWYQNADDIAQFLAAINPYWKRNRWQRMLFDHLQMVENQAIYRLNREYENDIAEFDRIEEQSLMMADYLAAGIINQFRI